MNLLSGPIILRSSHFFWVSDIRKLIEEVGQICRSAKSIKYEIGNDVFLGRDRNVKASKVLSENLHNLHGVLYEMAVRHDKKLTKINIRDNYFPHVTHNEEPYPLEGEIYDIEAIYVVEHIFPNKKNKKVLESFILV